MASKREPIVHQNLRLPRALHRELKRAARDNRLSLHAEIIKRLILPMGADLIAQRVFDMVQHKVGSNGQQAAAQGQAPETGPSLSQRKPEAET